MEISNLIKFGDRSMKEYEGLLMKADAKLHQHLAEEISKTLPIGAKILDLGAGEGALSQRLKNLGYDVTAVDINQNDFKADVPFRKCDFNSKVEMEALINEFSEKFDAVLGVEIIEHLENPWEYVRTLKSLTSPGGHIFISTPNTTSWYARLVFLRSGQFPSFVDTDVSGHINPISEWEIGVICNKSNLKLIRSRGAGTLPWIWIRSSIKKTLLNLLLIPLFPIMRGSLNGWCKIFVIKK